MTKKILIIDDDQGILEAIKAILELEGYIVETSVKHDYLDNVSLTNLPNLILIDLLLSGMDGKKIVKKIKGDHQKKDIPIIMLSAYPGADAQAIDAGADDFIAKPFDMNDLLSKVKKYTA